MEKLNFGDVLISYGLDLKVKLSLDTWQQAKPAIQYLETKLSEKRQEIQELERTISAQKLDIAEYELYVQWKNS